MFAPGDTVLVCVSGGPDSVCLLESLVPAPSPVPDPARGLPLRSSAAPGFGDGRRVRRRGSPSGSGLPFHLRSPPTPRPRASRSRRGRPSRGQAMSEDVAARVRRAGSIAEGHTLDDQAETVLLNLIRGGGLEAVGRHLARTGPHGRQPLARRPAATDGRSVLSRAPPPSSASIPTNRGTTLLRNAIRLEAIPTIERGDRSRDQAPIARAHRVLLRADRVELWNAAHRERTGDRRAPRGGGAVRRPIARGAARTRSPPGSSASALWQLAAVDDEAAPWTREAVAPSSTSRPDGRGGAGTCPADRRLDATGSMFASRALPPRSRE